MSEYIYPTSARGVSDNFQTHKNRKPPSVNPGTDYTCGYGTTVVAVKSGTVTIADSNNDGSGGRYIHIDHHDGTATEYLHLSIVEVRVGQAVTQGQEIAKSGASGFGSDHGYGAHLHIALKVNGSNVDFEKYVGQGSGPAPAPAGGLAQTAIDGVPGVITWKRLQTWLQRSYGYTGSVDGVPGPKTWKAFQSFLRSKGYTGPIDGVPGPNTYRALQRFAAENGYTGPLDGIPGPNTWKGIQRFANTI